MSDPCPRLLPLLAALSMGSFGAIFAQEEALSAQDRALFARYESGEVPDWSDVRDDLAQLGRPMALLALEGFDGADFLARRARAHLLADLGDPVALDALLARGEDEDPQVRRLLLRFFGRASLGDRRAAERVAILGGAVASDPDGRNRKEALEALAESTLPAAVAVLDRFLDELPEEEAVLAARSLVDLPAARARRVNRVVGAFDGSAPLAGPVLAELLRAYGTDLADLPQGGRRPQERVPLVLGQSHPDTTVARTSRRALNAVVSRLIDFDENQRAEDLLSALGDEGLDPRDITFRRVGLALTGFGDAQRALELARELQSLAPTAAAEESDTWRVYGLLFEGAAYMTLGRFTEAHEPFEKATGVLRSLGAERLELWPSPVSRVRSRAAGAVAIDRLHLAGLVEIWRALAFLAESGEPGHGPALRHLRRAHLDLFTSRVASLATGAQRDGSGWDTLLGRELGPRRLLIENPALEGEEAAGRLDLAALLGRALATVAPDEVPGFEPVSGVARELAEPLFDDLRRRELLRLREEQRRSLLDQLGDLRDRQRDDRALQQQQRMVLFQLQQIEESQRNEAARVTAGGGANRMTREELVETYAGLAPFANPPALFGLDLVNALRNDGRTAEARALGERMIAQLGEELPGANPVWTEWASARIEMSIGSTLMDDDQATTAERFYLAAVERLEALENTMEEMLRGEREGSSLAQQIQANLRMSRDLRASALLSVAVNANVRMDDQERALRYFEEAYALDQREFMEMLRACYRARSGRVEEARAVLRGIEPSPALYYNLACTHALLGDTDLALDYLRRDLDENHPTPGSRERQAEWARGDPDLASLRGDPRFERILAGPGR